MLASMPPHLATAATIALAAAFTAIPAPAAAGTITIVTSFPKDLTQVYKTAFEKQHPDIKVEILNKATSQGIAYVSELPAGQRPDIFWASAPDTFEVEFVTASGRTQALQTLMAADVRSVRDDDLLAVRPTAPLRGVA